MLFVAGEGTNKENRVRKVTLKIRAGVIRDGSNGISLSIGENLLGEWTDSRANRLSLTNDLKVAIRTGRGEQLYLFGVPGKPIMGEQLSENEVAISFEMNA